MSHAFACLDAEKRRQDDAIEEAERLSWTRSHDREKAKYASIAKRKTILLQRMGLIGRVCVQYKLPSGDPPWLARAIGNFE
jgi:hypothetical protein